MPLFIARAYALAPSSDCATRCFALHGDYVAMNRVRMNTIASSSASGSLDEIQRGLASAAAASSRCSRLRPRWFACANRSLAPCTRRRLPSRCSRIAHSRPIASKRVPRTLFAAIVPSHGTITYAYDVANRLTGMTHTPQAPAVGSAQSITFNYDTANRRTKVTLPNTVEMNYVYDNASQLSSITYKKGATTLGDLTYTYDAAGRRTKIAGSYARTNLPTAIPGTNASYNVNNQQTAWGAASAIAHTYDFNGNLTADGTYTYLWNARNQLREVKQGATTIALYEYDAFGRRKQKSINGTITKFLYDGHNFIQEQGSTGNAVANIFGGLALDEQYARIKTPTTTPTTSSFLMDHLGTIIAESDGAGTVPTSYTYEPYGKTTQTGTASDNSQRYTGREQDFGDLYYYRARYYSTNESRFSAEDPIGRRGGPNFFAYVDGDPVGLNDPWGLFSTAPNCDDCPEKKRIVTQLTASCDRLDRTITDKTLRDCIKDKCKTIVVSCQKGCFPNFGGGAFDPNRPGQIVLCVGAGAPKNADYGGIGVHEIAHACGWQHCGGGGVPYQLCGN
jgi:RHS repeat-associated protein